MSARSTVACLLLAALAAAPARADDDAPSLTTEITGGMGIGTRSFERPTAAGGTQRLSASAFPAIDLGLKLQGWPERRFALAAVARYQTSVGLHVQEQPDFAPINEVDVRAQHIEVGAVPRFRLAEDPDALAIAFPFGFTVRTFWADVRDLQTPSYTLAGPHLRVEVIAPLGRHVRLRIGPELHALLFVGRDLRDGGTESLGLSLGGEAALRVRLGEVFAAELAYREAHAFVAHESDGEGFEDVERFATLRLVGAL